MLRFQDKLKLFNPWLWCTITDIVLEYIGLVVAIKGGKALAIATRIMIINGASIFFITTLGV